MALDEIWNELALNERRDILTEYQFPECFQDEVIHLNKDDFELWLLNYAQRTYSRKEYSEIKTILGY